MNNDALDAFARQTAAIFTRRRTMQAFGIGALGAIAAGFEDILGEKDKKKKRRKKRKKRQRQRKRRKQGNNTSPPPDPDPPEPTCFELCDSSSEGCFERAADSTLCADTLSTDCTPCRSDQECIDSDSPYCLTSITIRDSGLPSTLLTALCGGFTDGVCAALIVL